jgi:hypothetical protein
MAKKQHPRKVFRLSPEWQGRFNFTAEQVVNLFLDTNSMWFTDKDNALYGKRAEAHRALLYFLNTGEDISETYGCTYVLSKFQSEWMGHNLKPVFVEAE